MKNTSLLFVALLCCLQSSAGNLQPATGNTFEGNLTLTSEKNGSTGNKTLLAVKNDMVAISPGSGPQMVLNVKTGDFQTVIDQGGQKIVAKLNVEVLSSLPEMPSFLGPFSDYLGKKETESEVEVTDEIKNLSGYKCRKYIIKDDETVSTVWAAEEFPFSLSTLMDLLKVSGSSNSALKASFPLQASVKNKQTNEVSGFKVEVERKPLDEKIFTMPADLLEMDMTALIQQMLQTNEPAQIKNVLDSLIPH